MQTQCKVTNALSSCSNILAISGLILTNSTDSGRNVLWDADNFFFFTSNAFSNDTHQLSSLRMSSFISAFLGWFRSDILRKGEKWTLPFQHLIWHKILIFTFVIIIESRLEILGLRKIICSNGSQLLSLFSEWLWNYLVRECLESRIIYHKNERARERKRLCISRTLFPFLKVKFVRSSQEMADRLLGEAYISTP